MATKAPMQTVPASLMTAPLVGYNLKADTLQGLLHDGPTLLVFLRHFGCIFCKEMVADLQAAARANPAYPRVLFVAHGELAYAEPFFASTWPEASCIVDADRRLYAAFGVERMGLSQMFNPGMIACGVRAAGKGHMQGATKGDSQQMPGLFYLEGSRVLWQHDFKHAGDHPEWAALPQRLPVAPAANLPSAAALQAA